MKYIKNYFKNANIGNNMLYLVKMADVLLLCTHIILMIIYIIIPSKIMVFISIGSLIVYISGFFIIYKKHIRTFLIMTFIEAWLHIIIGVNVLGWNSGYQYWLFGLISAFFVQSYYYSNSLLNTNRYASLIMGTINGLTFFLLYHHSFRTDTLIILKSTSKAGQFLYDFNAFIGISSVILFTYIYTNQSYERQRQLQKCADYDQLTGLFNRYQMRHTTDDMIEVAQMKKTGFGVAIVDIDLFKNINDTYGHNEGDVILMQLSEILRKYAGGGLNVGRWGGEEFLYIGNTTITYEEFVTTMETLRKHVDNSIFGSTGKRLHITVSVGCAWFVHGMIFEDIIQVADNNLYKAKQTGRNKVIS